MAATIRVSITEDIEILLKKLKENIPNLDYSDVFMLGLSEAYRQQKDRRKDIESRKAWADGLPTLEISKKQAKSIAKGRKEIEDGDYSTLPIEDLFDPDRESR